MLVMGPVNSCNAMRVPKPYADLVQLLDHHLKSRCEKAGVSFQQLAGVDSPRGLSRAKRA